MEPDNPACISTQRGGTIPNTTLSSIQWKLRVMQGAALILLLWLQSLVMVVLVKPIATLIGFTQDSIYLSLLIVFLGIGLGFVVVGIKRLPFRLQRYLKTGIFTAYPLFLLIVYLTFGVTLFFDLIVFLIKILFIVLLCAIPLLITYGILKKNRTAVIAPSIGMIVLFFLTRGISGSFIILPIDIWLFILFFIVYILFFELALGSIYFSSIVDHLTPQKQENEFVLQRFTMVFHSYVLYLSITMVLCFVFTGGVVLLKDLFISTNSFMVFGMSLRSLSGLYLLVILVCIGVVFFWLLAPMGKHRKIPRLPRLNRTQTK